MNKPATGHTPAKETIQQNQICGIIMPISGSDGCSESHWQEVKNILIEAILEAGFDGKIVSTSDESGLIHKRIIENLYDNPIVVCDVSSKNPNVMFELGMRLAFDKPTIIIKDDKTSYSFDTAGIEHLEYPRDLRFNKIVAFKELLTQKIRATHKSSTTDKGYTTFLKHFGEFTVAKIEKKEISSQDYLLSEMQNVSEIVRKLEQQINYNKRSMVDNRRYYEDHLAERKVFSKPMKKTITQSLKQASEAVQREVAEKIMCLDGVTKVMITKSGHNDESQVAVSVSEESNLDFLKNEIAQIVDRVR